MKRGACALTGNFGPYVKAHILPKALTRPEEKGAPLMQSTKGQGYKKRFSSWYDPNLVTKEGEDILAKLDDLAIKQLRCNLLIWSSWIVFKPPFETFSPALNSHAYRTISIQSPNVLHKFFLSLAWRSCASRLPEMQHAFANPEHIELMRAAIVSEKEIDCTFFPVSLTQLTTMGLVHNLTPWTDTVTPPEAISKNIPENSWEIIRIYFDGLVAHVHLDPQKKQAKGNMSFLGGKDHMLVPGVTYEASYEYENLLFNIWESQQS